MISQPTDEPQESLRNTIRDCKRSLTDRSLGDAAVVFLISQVGDDKEATSFLKRLENDEGVGRMVFCSTENLAMRLASFQSIQQGKQYTAWVSRLS